MPRPQLGGGRGRQTGSPAPVTAATNRGGRASVLVSGPSGSPVRAEDNWYWAAAAQAPRGEGL